jgi:hypothetical protein
MATTAIETDCGCGSGEQSTGDGLLPANPYIALQYHFGMLLGVDDLETAQAYPRGKIRLHNAWLHREGVVWGFDVQFNKRRELAVMPGLALDAAGHELHLDTTACVDLGKWYDKHKDDEGFTFTATTTGAVQFDAHVVARFRACLARPVPAIADPCGCVDGDTAFSRITETVELLLRPGKAPAKNLGYHRLRILFALEDDDATKYDEVRIRREAILAMATVQQPRAYLDAFREFAALDEIDLTPQVDESGAVASLFPEEPTDVVLADVLGIVVGAAAGGASGSATLDPLPTPNVRIRRSHVATATIQELLCGPLFALSAVTPPVLGDGADAGGPRINRDSATLTTQARSTSIALTLTAPVDLASAHAAGFTVSTYTSADGWTTIDIDSVTVDNTTNTITVNLKTSVAPNSVIRLIARGTGPQPLLGINFVPLAGAVGGPPGTVDDGHDFHIMLRSS